MRSRITHYLFHSLSEVNPYIVSGPDGALWFTSQDLNAPQYVGRITTLGSVTKYAVPGLTDHDLLNPTIVVGSDGRSLVYRLFTDA